MPHPLHTIVIIGAGFSGALTAVHLLRQAPSSGLRVILINRSGRMARGVAYGTRSVEHVLNVPAGNMSALADDPDDFLRFCHWTDPSISTSSFVSRRLYGTYLESLLAAAEHGCTERVSLQRLVGEVTSVDVRDDGGKACVLMQDGTQIVADRVVLAFGHFPPAHPHGAPGSFCASDRYIRDPWVPGALETIAPSESVLLLGSGLTTVDVALSLSRVPRTAPIICVSRRGLLPRSHRIARGSSNMVDVDVLLGAMGSTARAYVQAVRRYVREHVARGEDWRDVLAALRPHTPRLWHRLVPNERRRFLRHVQPYWDVLRHRCAPETFAGYAGLLASGALRVIAGRVLSWRENEQGVDVALRRRGECTVENLRVARVINCTGPETNLPRVENRLVQSLLSDGSICPDALGLGLEVAENYALVNAEGAASDVLYYVGPLLRARDWEATAVPELRVHAQRLAQILLR